MVEVTSDEQQASSQCFPLLLWLHFIWLSFFLSCCMEKTKVERDFPQHSQFSASEQPAMSPQGFAKEKLVQDAFFYFEGAVFRLLLPLFSYCVLEKLIQIAFSLLYNVRTFQTHPKAQQKGDASSLSTVVVYQFLSTTASNSLRAIGHNEKLS